LAERIQEFIQPLVYHTPPLPEIREEMIHYRIRMEKERSGEDRGRINPKLGHGGMTDIEFIVQYLQWTYGLTPPELRQNNTLKALKALRDKAYLPEETFLLLKEAYQFLGLLDHGLQLLYDRKGDPRTYEPGELKHIAELNVLGLGSADLPSWDMVTHYYKVRQNVRLIFNRIFQLNDSGGIDIWPSLKFSVGSNPWVVIYSPPQIKVANPSSTVNRAMVLMITARSDCPIKGRRVSRSINKPMMMATPTAPRLACSYSMRLFMARPRQIVACRFHFRPAGQKDQGRQERHHQPGPDRKVLRTAWFKKNGSNLGARALQILRESLERLSQETLPSALFLQPPVIYFTPEKTRCFCGGRLGVQKTRRKTVLSMNGPFIAQETVFQCRACARVFGSDVLLQLVPSRCNVAYDVLVFIGQALFQRQRTPEEVRTDLAARNGPLCVSEFVK
jgi:hypothetical protein